MASDPAALIQAEAAAKRIDEWRAHLSKLATNSIADIEERSFLGRELRAAAVVAAMAELEALLREMLVSIGSHVNASGITVAQLLPSLRALAADSAFQSLTQSGDHDKVWANRASVTTMESSLEFARLPSRTFRSPQPPLDGRTIQSRHISLIWGVLGISDPIPSASIVASLKKLTQLRNDIAHRNVDIAQVFSEAGRTAADLVQYLDDIVLLLLHIGNEWNAYLERQGYRATP